MLRLILLPILFLLPAIPALAATINVDSNCTLAQAVISAGNDSAPADSGCEDGDNDDTIQLSYYVRITATLPIVSSGDKITIDGGGYTVRGGGSGSDFRMLSVPSDVSVVLQNITIADFHVSASGNDSGGAIIVNGGIENNTVVIRNAVFRDNSATGRDPVGGAIWFSGGVDSILIEDSFFIDNHTIGSGGAIFLESSATINNTAFIGNSAQNGGAIHVNNDVELTLTNSSFINNEVPESNGTGGALRFFNNSGSTVESTLTHVTF
ncbi:MAG: hypothetical protein J4G18_18860, partial [Anaerolineae bacterium]|nr:hypothetical protein [Anaerolineae bacterium]